MYKITLPCNGSVDCVAMIKRLKSGSSHEFVGIG